MTDYNNGAWWGWNGGECPVDPLCEVECIYPAEDMQNDTPYWSVSLAEIRFWHRTFLFRVTKPAPPKPREGWIYLGDLCASKDQAMDNYGKDAALVRVREVTE